ncbi:hypothetical protein [Ferruginibacter sp.]
MQYGCGEIKISPLSRCWYRSRDNEPWLTNNIIAKDVTNLLPMAILFSQQQAVLLVRLRTIANAAYQRRCGGLRSTNKG